jgi:hypothetical protein
MAPGKFHSKDISKPQPFRNLRVFHSENIGDHKYSTGLFATPNTLRASLLPAAFPSCPMKLQFHGAACSPHSGRARRARKAVAAAKIPKLSAKVHLYCDISTAANSISLAKYRFVTSSMATTVSITPENTKSSLL